MKRKSLIDAGVKEIRLPGGEVYYIDEDCGVERGGSSLVYRVKNENGTYYILKECCPKAVELSRDENGDLCCRGDKDRALFESYKKLAFQETAILEELKISKNRAGNDEYILRAERIFKLHNTVYMLLSSNAADNLEQYIKRFDKKVTERELCEMLQLIKGICRAAGNLHEKKWLHLDIAPQNIIIDSNTHLVRLIDLNSAYKKGGAYDRPFSMREGFSAPELAFWAKGIKYGKLTDKTDVYSIGAVIYYIITGGGVFETADKYSGAWERLIDERLKCIPKSAEYRKIRGYIKRLIADTLNNGERIGVEEIISSVERIEAAIINAPSNRRGRRYKWLGAVAAGIIFVMVSVYLLFPTVLLYRAEGQTEHNWQSALNLAEKVYYEAKPWQIYSQEKMKRVLHDVYYSGKTELEFDGEVSCAIIKNGEVTAALKDGRIVAVNLEENKVRELFEAEVENGELSHNGKYFSILKDKRLEVYSLGSELRHIYAIDAVDSYSFDENSRSIIVLSENRWIIHSLEKIESDISGALPEPAALSSKKCCDLSMEKRRFAYVSQNGVIVCDFEGNQVAKIDMEAAAVQFSCEAEVLGLYTKNGEIAYNYDEKSYEPMKIYDYRYMVDLKSDRFYWFENGKVLRFEGNKVWINSYRLPFVASNMKLTERDARSVLEKCDVDYPYYYDYDENECVIFRTDLIDGKEERISVNKGIRDMVINSNSFLLVYDNKLVFCTLDNGVLLMNEEITLEDTAYRFSGDRNTLALITDSEIVIYKYNGSWSKQGAVTLSEKLKLADINSDGTMLVGQNAVMEVVWYDINGLQLTRRVESVNPLTEISANYETGIGRTTDGRVFLVDLKKNGKIKNTAHMSENGIVSYFDKSNIVASAVQGNRIVIDCNDSEISSDAVSLPEEINGRLYFVERMGENDSLVMYNLKTKKRQILHDELYIGVLAPEMYALYAPGGEYLNISAIVGLDMTVNMLYKDYSIEELLSLCKEK